MAAVKAVERQYLRPGNHTRVRKLCNAGEGLANGQCKNRPSQRVYFNVGSVLGMTLLLCHEHAVNYLDAPRTHSHVKNINRRYRAARNWPDTYRAS
jgi:hypothetical protein